MKLPTIVCRAQKGGFPWEPSFCFITINVGYISPSRRLLLALQQFVILAATEEEAAGAVVLEVGDASVA